MKKYSGLFLQVLFSPSAHRDLAGLQANVFPTTFNSVCGSRTQDCFRFLFVMSCQEDAKRFAEVTSTPQHQQTRAKYAQGKACSEQAPGALVSPAAT